MILSKETTVKLNQVQANIICHMGYAAYKLWNCLKYERDHYKELGLEQYPDWYYQKKYHKNDLWYKALPAQTAQEVCKLLEKGYQSFFALLKTHGIQNPHAPKYKHDIMPITYDPGNFAHSGKLIRLTISKQMKQHLAERYGIHENFLYLENGIFQDMDHIKQLRLYMPEGNVMRMVVVYEISDVPSLSDNGKYLSIDLGLHNLMTVYDSTSGNSFILGRTYNNVLHNFDKQIAHYQSISDLQQNAAGIKYPKKTKRVLRLYRQKRNSVKDLLHKATKWIIDYCLQNDIHTVVIGEVTHIRDEKNFGDKTNQKFHQWPYQQIYQMLQYKCAMNRLVFVRISEAYSSQTPPSAPAVGKDYAVKKNRIRRGLYRDGNQFYNADSVGAYNILRLYLQSKKKPIFCSYCKLGNPVKVSV